MPMKVDVLLAGRSKDELAQLSAELGEQSSYAVRTRHIQNGHADPLFGLSEIPDVVVLLLNEHGNADLDALVEEQKPGRPPLIVVSENGGTQTMRLAMKAGARDFFAGALEIDDLVASIGQVASQLDDEDRQSNLTVFVNAKGGSGATFLACNVAHILKSASEFPSALLNLDLQFESLGPYFDTELKHGLMQVLESVEDLDSVALDAYMTQHHSGLRMLAALPENVIQCHGDKADKLAILLDKMVVQYDHVVVDMPRRVDPYVVPVLEKATRIVLVVQQTLGHLRDASRMLQIFRSYGVADDRVLAVINRYEKNSPITEDDVCRALHGVELTVVPSDFKTVAESTNLGVPIHEHARNCSVTKALLALETRLGGQSAIAGPSFFGKAIANILRK